MTLQNLSGQLRRQRTGAEDHPARFPSTEDPDGDRGFDSGRKEDSAGLDVFLTRQTDGSAPDVPFLPRLPTSFWLFNNTFITPVHRMFRLRKRITSALLKLVFKLCIYSVNLISSAPLQLL